MSEFYKRLLQLSEYKGFKSVNKFALDGLNYSSSEKLNRLKKENNNPSFEIILDISNKFEDVNLNWLITGKGEMIGESILTATDANEIFKVLHEPPTEYESKAEVLQAHKKTIEVLENVVLDLRSNNKLLQKIVEEKCFQ